MCSSDLQDIVCAGISMLTITILNGLSEIIGLKGLIREIAEGYTSFSLPEIKDDLIKIRVDTLLDTYELGIKATESAYSDYVKVVDKDGGE
mgnify:FL=1